MHSSSAGGGSRGCSRRVQPLTTSTMCKLLLQTAEGMACLHAAQQQQQQQQQQPSVFLKQSAAAAAAAATNPDGQAQQQLLPQLNAAGICDAAAARRWQP